jgi:hypothetical protein
MQLDPLKETADIDLTNNGWGKMPEQPSRFKVFTSHQPGDNPNPIQKQKAKGF